MAHLSLLASNCVSQLEVQKAYTKSINLELCRMIHTYLVTERVPHVKGEPYMVEQVQEVADYVFEGKDPWFESPGQLSQLKKLKKAPQLLSTNEATTSEQG